jgi:hypothetical protein
MMTEKAPVKNIRIRFVKNGFIWEASPYGDGSGADIEVFNTPRQLQTALRRVLLKL